MMHELDLIRNLTWNSEALFDKCCLNMIPLGLGVWELDDVGLK